MFCPNCGKENSAEIKFCASCGTNLEAVSHALTGTEENFFTRFDAGIDQFISRYTEHVFKNPGNENTVARSWKLLGQGFLTSIIDMILFVLMWNILPMRALLLLISTPFRLLSERDDQPSLDQAFRESYRPPELGEADPEQASPRLFPSVTENTTSNLRGKTRDSQEKVPVTDRLE